MVFNDIYWKEKSLCFFLFNYYFLFDSLRIDKAIDGRGNHFIAKLDNCFLYHVYSFFNTIDS